MLYVVLLHLYLMLLISLVLVSVDCSANISVDCNTVTHQLYCHMGSAIVSGSYFN